MPRRRSSGTTCRGKKITDLPFSSSDVTASSLSWAALPDDCWQSIFARFDDDSRRGAVSLVCKRFQNIINRLQTDLLLSSSSASHLNRLCSRFPNLHSIHLGHPLPHLDDFIRQLADSNIPLQSFHLSHQTWFPRMAMRQLGGSSVNRTLKTLKCTDFDRLVDGDLFIIAKSFSYLHRLELNCPTPSNLNDCMSDEAIRAIAMSLTSLVSFTFECFSSITHQSFEYLSSYCPSLSHLRSYCFSVDGTYDIQCFSVFPFLTSLEIFSIGISDIGLEVLTTANLKLTKLHLQNSTCEHVNGAAICRFLKFCTSLSVLHLVSFKFPLKLKGLEFASSIPNVRDIYLVLCTRLPRKILCNLLRKCPYLYVIYISDSCIGTLEDSITAGIRNSLRSLVLGHCRDLSDETLADISTVCPNLDYFYSFQCSRITKRGADAIRANCRYLRELIIKGGYHGFKLKKKVSS